MSIFNIPRILILLIAICTISNVSAQKIPSFPGAQGHGMYTSGGRGGKVIKVTNLNDSGEGSFRAAATASGARIVVFDTSGTIQLKSRLSIDNDSITVAGQTAPGDGICIRDYAVYVNADNVIIRYMRFRLGDETNQEDDAIGGRDSKNVIIDHCSMSWSTDECVSFYQNQNFTMQWCLIGESLRNSVHTKGGHGYGGIWGGEKASFHHNLLANHSSRNPRFSGSRYDKTDLEHVDFRNNVIYNWEYNSAYGAEGGNYNLVNNYYKYGPATNEKVRSRIIHADTDNGENTQNAGVHGIFFVEGNYVFGDETVTNNNWNGGVDWEVETHLKTDDLRSETEFGYANVFTDNAEEAYSKVLEFVGASLSRDAVDVRTIHDVQNGTATFTDGGKGSKNGIIDTQSAVGGWPELKSEPAPTDQDGDGMPDDWEAAKGLNAEDLSDANKDRNNDSYTNIEEYINSLTHGYFDTKPTINTLSPAPNQFYLTTNTIDVLLEAYTNDFNGGTISKVELLVGNQIIKEQNTSAISATISNLSIGTHHIIVRATDDSNNVSVDTTTVYVGSKEININIEESEYGIVNMEPPGGVYCEGIDVKVIAEPNGGYTFWGWEKDLLTTQNPLPLTTTSDIRLKPIFVPTTEIVPDFSELKINFQSADEPVPGGYLPDYGRKYSYKKEGYYYGWIEGDNNLIAINRNQLDPRLQSYAIFEYREALSWGIEIPNGKYKITVGLGGEQQRVGVTELKIDVEGTIVNDPDGPDYFDEHILNDVIVEDGELTLKSIEQSRICYIIIELIEKKTYNCTVISGTGSGNYGEGELVVISSDMASEGMRFDKWIGEIDFVDNINSTTTFMYMPKTELSLEATYKTTVEKDAYHLIVVNGSGGGFYEPGTDVKISAPDNNLNMYFSHWEYEALEEMDFNSTSSSFLFTTVNMGVVFTPVYQSTPVSATKIETSDVALNVKCYPNPVEDIATISITTGQPWDIDAVLFDIQGTKIRSVCNGYFPAGKQTFTLLKENLKPGIYILCVKTNGTQENVKILFK